MCLLPQRAHCDMTFTVIVSTLERRTVHHYIHLIVKSGWIDCIVVFILGEKTDWRGNIEMFASQVYRSEQGPY